MINGLSFVDEPEIQGELKLRQKIVHLGWNKSFFCAIILLHGSCSLVWWRQIAEVVDKNIFLITREKN